MRKPPALCIAIAYWRNGRNIPIDLFAELADAGLDVPSLENHYFDQGQPNHQDMTE